MDRPTFVSASGRARLVRTLAAAALLAAPVSVGVSTQWAAGAEPRGRVVTQLSDPRIIEASGLVKLGPHFVTTNDSGDVGMVYVVDASTGQTVGTTLWDDNPRDVEALAPAGRDAVWVGDIGDNQHSRASIEVTEVPVGVGDRVVDEETIDLTWPDVAHDAEALLAHPISGQLFVASKDVFSGGLYAAPPKLSDDGRNRLKLVADLPGIVTDGAFFDDGRHLIVRTYTHAFVYAFPSMDLVDSFRLPRQPQGEAIAVSGTKVFVTTEGQRPQVLQVRLPLAVRRALSPQPTATPRSSPSPATAADVPDATADSTPEPLWRRPAPLLGVALAVVVGLGALGWRMVRRDSRGPSSPKWL